MKRIVTAVVVSLVLAGTFALAQTPNPQSPQAPATEQTPASQNPQPSVAAPTPSPQSSQASATAPASQEQKAPESTLTGCLVQGSGPTVFILENARLSTDAKTAEGKKYLVMMADPASLRNQLNRQVSVTGTRDSASAAVRPAPGAGEKAEEKADERDLPKFSGKTILRVADVCTTA